MDYYFSVSVDGKYSDKSPPMVLVGAGFVCICFLYVRVTKIFPGSILAMCIDPLHTVYCQILTDHYM